MGKRKLIEIYLKGIFMGLADIIPGVSGGTIAFITGIYERLITAIKSLNPMVLVYGLLMPFNSKYSRKFKENLKAMDLKFLLILLFGISTAFMGASKVILIALNNFPTYTYSFFFGLILASAIMIYEQVENLEFKTILTGSLGFVFAFLLVGQETVQFSHTIPMVFVSGMIAICAMILPGISGSFMLLFLGQYEYMLEALQNFSTQYPVLIAFIIGALIGLLSFTRVLSYLFKTHKSLIVAVLVGLMLGALRLPASRILYISQYYPSLPFSWNFLTISLTLLSGIIGIVVVFKLEEKP